MAPASPRLVFVFDDGYVEDIEMLHPLFERAGVPATVAINPTAIGTRGRMSEGELRTLRSDGWELLAHGREHRHMQGQHLVRPAEAGDTRVFVSGPVFPGEGHGFVPGDRFSIGDVEDREIVRIASTGADVEGEYIQLRDPLTGSYTSEEGFMRPTREVIRDEICGTATDLADLGFDPVTFVFPYDAADVRAWQIAREQYEVIPNTSIRSLPNPPGRPLRDLRRYYLETDALTRQELAEYLDAVVATGGLGILSGHSSWETVPADRVEWVIEAAKQRDIHITTFREMLASGADCV